VLQRAAVAALTQPVPRDGQFVYTEITGTDGIFTAPGSPATVRERMRPGVAVAMQELGLSNELIFDPHTYRVHWVRGRSDEQRRRHGKLHDRDAFFAMAVLPTAITSTAPFVPASDTYVFQPSTSHPPPKISPADLPATPAGLI
jgi:hypothetical protein